MPVRQQIFEEIYLQKRIVSVSPNAIRIEVELFFNAWIRRGFFMQPSGPVKWSRMVHHHREYSCDTMDTAWCAVWLRDIPSAWCEHRNLDRWLQCTVHTADICLSFHIHGVNDRCKYPLRWPRTTRESIERENPSEATWLHSWHRRNIGQFAQ